MKRIHSKSKLKMDKIEEADIYLGVELSKMTIVDGHEFWDMSSDKYFSAAVKNKEFFL